ncbi:conserved hypothetical protein [Enterococcus phage phiFL1B]|jgi:hypothetical protein|uniref:Uncharacterized protein n=7 Tax=root TaxID=1 RepID=D2IYW3_9CAUD|nr:MULTISPECIES: hypothetical protein [Enterococcus]YP_003347498.1 hypothetical protein EP-phiFL1Ap41 [Enterococcus phage phiFL1A]ACZ63802.1 conserved hypothetical protein [Enterococcus phage phiFL1B]ACZ63871.1 conserved hypothetical protein [Enterococcus phage phiFL1C]ACZ63998.1 conserved hypothetical protein [Enterococcus phage phiFL2B]MDN6219885.1 hypothetical protein [Lactococcus lactis]DAM95814.1 MAG TPA: hypothetical protein [Caudoviricetes sp.]
MNENNQTLEATFFETQRSLEFIAKQGKYLFDKCLDEGFNENQALRFTIGILTGVSN